MFILQPTPLNSIPHCPHPPTSQNCLGEVTLSHLLHNLVEMSLGV